MLAADPGADEPDGSKRSRRAVRASAARDEDKIAWDQVDLDDEPEQLPNGNAYSMLPSAAGRATKRARTSPDAKWPKEDGTQQDAPVTEAELETHVAWSVGLDPHALSDEEEAMGLASSFDESAYVKVRNHVLTLWRLDVSRWLTEEEAAAKIMPRFRSMVTAAWRFLTTGGYINFGVGPGIAQRPNIEQQRESIIVIGAGLAGMSAARQLRNWGYQVVVLEGRNRPGGRVYTKRLQGDFGEAAVADLGGSIITGIDGNPLAVLARQMGIPMHDIDGGDVPLYMRDGTEPDGDIDEEVQNRFNECLDGSFKFRDELGAGGDGVSLQTVLDEVWKASEEPRPFDWLAQGLNNAVGQSSAGAVPGRNSSHANHTEHRQEQQQQQNGQTTHESGLDNANMSSAARLELEHKLKHWHMANIEFANAARLGDLSMRHWDQDDPFEHPGAHCFLPGGNLRLVQGLAAGIPIMYNARVNLVQYSTEGGVMVHTADGAAYCADAAIVTVPLGVLKRTENDGTGLCFQPQLPPRKRAAISRLGFGVLNKVVLLFPYPFWGDLDMFGHIQDEPRRRGELYLFYTYADVSGGAVLAGLVAGDAALDIEQVPAKTAVERAMEVLRDLFRPKGIEVPEPLQAVRTRWGCDPMAYGSYSSVAVGARGAEEYEALAEPVAGRLFFAGEATTAKYPATMHGAFTTGLREAANVAAALGARRGARHRGSGSAGGSAGSTAARMQAPVQLTPDAAAASARLLAAEQMAEQVFSAAEGAYEPDYECGCITAVFGPLGSTMEQEALVRIELSAGASKAKGSKSNRRGKGDAGDLPQYAYMRLSLAQLRVLQQEYSDEDRLSLLTEFLGLRLVGRDMSDRVLQLLEAIYYAQQQES